jgi:peptide/nickel transport system permease protein
MIGYIVRRSLVAIPLLFGLLTMTFFLIRLAPGDPATFFLDPSIDPSAADQLRKNLGLDDPLPVQYGKWLGVLPPFEGVLQGEFGTSFSRHQPVVSILSEAAWNTLILTMAALIVDLVVGILLGIVSALKRGQWIDRTISVIGLFFYSMPNFWLGLMLILIFSLWLGWLPASQMSSIGAERLGTMAYLQDRIAHMIMPVFVLGIASAASTVRYMRSSMLEVLNQDYIRTARAKGLKERDVIRRHAFRNALMPIITVVGLSFPFLLSGAVVTEVVFAWPGMGRVTVDAIFARDYPLIIGCTMMAGMMVIAGNLLSDILYAMADPRVRLRR